MRLHAGRGLGCVENGTRRCAGLNGRARVHESSTHVGEALRGRDSGRRLVAPERVHAVGGRP